VVTETVQNYKIFESMSSSTEASGRPGDYGVSQLQGFQEL
jgi:hypothetical protein